MKLIRVWTKTNAKGEVVELFEGYFSLFVESDWSLQFKWLVTSEAAHGFSFWAVRAKKDKNGKEIGLSTQKETSSLCGC
jgi:hypothetical protein